MPGGAHRRLAAAAPDAEPVRESYIRLVTRLSARDCTSGYRCWRRDALGSIPIAHFSSEGYSFLVEMLYAAAAARLRFAEVPITFVERRLGESKLSRAVLLESAITPWRLIGSRRRRRRPRVEPVCAMV